MMIGFFVLTLAALVFLTIGISCLRATELLGVPFCSAGRIHLFSFLRYWQ